MAVRAASTFLRSGVLLQKGKKGYLIAIRALTAPFKLIPGNQLEQ